MLVLRKVSLIKELTSFVSRVTIAQGLTIPISLNVVMYCWYLYSNIYPRALCVSHIKYREWNAIYKILQFLQENYEMTVSQDYN